MNVDEKNQAVLTSFHWTTLSLFHLFMLSSPKATYRFPFQLKGRGKALFSMHFSPFFLPVEIIHYAHTHTRTRPERAQLIGLQIEEGESRVSSLLNSPAWKWFKLLWRETFSDDATIFCHKLMNSLITSKLVAS